MIFEKNHKKKKKCQKPEEDKNASKIVKMFSQAPSQKIKNKLKLKQLWEKSTTMPADPILKLEQNIQKGLWNLANKITGHKI